MGAGELFLPLLGCRAAGLQHLGEWACSSARQTVEMGLVEVVYMSQARASAWWPHHSPPVRWHGYRGNTLPCTPHHLC